MYELLYLIPTTQPEEELKQIKNKVLKVIQDQEGRIIKEESLGKRRLAYTIKQGRHSFYELVQFEATGELLKKINEKLKLIPEILRYQIIKIKAPVQATKVLEERKKPRVKKEKEAKVSLEELDKKLEEILEGEIE